MTYGLQIFNDSGQLVISSDAVGYRYLGQPTLISDAIINYDEASLSYNIIPYTYTINLPASGVGLYPLVGIKLNSSIIVDIISTTVISATGGYVDHIIGISLVRRAVNTSTGAVYVDAYSTTGAQFAPINGPLYIRNGAIYEYNTAYNRYDLLLYLKGNQAVALSNPDHDPLVYKGTLTIEVNSVNKVGALLMNSVVFSPPTLHVFIPYTNSDGASGYGLNLYNSLGNLTFSSNQQMLTINQKVEFIAANASTSPNLSLTAIGQSNTWNPLNTAIILTGAGQGNTNATRGGEDFYQRAYGWTYTDTSLRRVPYITSSYPDTPYGSVLAGTTVYKTTALIVDGSTLVPSTNFTGYLQSAGSDVTSQGTAPQGIAISPDRKHVYITNTFNNSIVQYNRNSSGALNTPRGIYTSGGYNNGDANWPVVSPDGTCVYVACPNGPAGGTVDRFTRDLSTGYLTYTSSWSVPQCYFVAISPDGLNLYASSFSGTSTPISIFTIGSTGVLTPYTTMGVPTANAGSFSWTISSDGLSVYLCLYSVRQVAVYLRNPDTGALTYQQLVGTDNYQVGTYPSYSAISPDGNFFYVSNYGNNSITVYSRNSLPDSPAYATLLYSSYILTDANPAGIVISSDGKFLYCAMLSSSFIKVYSRNASNGTLALHSTISTGAAPYTLAISSDDASIYTANVTGNSIGQYNRSIA